MAAVLAGLGRRAIATAATHEDAVTSGRYAELAARGEVPDLLSGKPWTALEEAVITAESPQWDDIGLGAITDFVQQAFGPVNLDRSLVELTVTAAPRPGCPACAGRGLKFPADLADAQDSMCPAHRNEAEGGDQEADRAGGGQQSSWMADARRRLRAAVVSAPAWRPGHQARGGRKGSGPARPAPGRGGSRIPRPPG